MLNRDELLAIDDVKVEMVKDIPYWGDVYIRTFSAGKRDAMEAAHIANPYKNFRARFVCASLCDEHGKLIFSDADIEKVSEKSASVIDPIFTAVSKLNKVTQEDVEDLEKNS